MRTPLFMAESLARLISDEKKQFEKTQKKIKKLEDSLGAIDENDGFYQLFSKNKKIQNSEVLYFCDKREKAVRKLNEKLIKKDFYQDTFNVLANLPSPDFNNKPLIEALHKKIKQEINDCLKFYIRYSEEFTSMEDQVHELRRKLRWISIYTQSLDGIIILDEDKTKYAWEKEFITKAEVLSPYNKVPVTRKLPAHIHFNKKAFLALSHIVATLGMIKDKGLQMEALAKAVRKTSGLSHKEASTLVIKQLSLKYKEQDLLREAHALAKRFFTTYKIHELLLAEKI